MKFRYVPNAKIGKCFSFKDPNLYSLIWEDLILKKKKANKNIKPNCS